MLTNEIDVPAGASGLDTTTSNRACPRLCPSYRGARVGKHEFHAIKGTERTAHDSWDLTLSLITTLRSIPKPVAVGC